MWHGLPGITDIGQMFQITALSEYPFPQLNTNNPENEEHEKTEKEHITQHGERI